MPVNQAADFILDNKPFMLVRNREYQGRAWNRSAQSDVPYRPGVRSYSNLPPEINMKEIWDDWQAGYGDAYREPERPNAVHWSENFDTRFPRQLVHCQELQLLPARYASCGESGQAIYEVPLPGVASPPVGAGAVLVLGKGYVAHFVPTGLNTAGSAFDHQVEATGAGITFAGRPATWGSFSFIGNSAGSGFYRRGHDATYTVAGLPAEGFTVAGNRLWRRHRKNLVQSCAVEGIDTFSAGNWSATLAIGNGQMAIGDMIEQADQVFLGLPDGLYAGDQSGTFFNVLSELRNQRHGDNARDLSIQNYGILTPHVGGMWWFRPSDYVNEAREVGPGGTSARSPLRGRLRCVHSFGQWNYAGLWTGSESYILAGREATTGVNYGWHVMQRIPHAAKISRIHVDSITTPSGGATEIAQRMWVLTEQPVSGVGTAPTYFTPIPRINDNPLTPDPAFSANYCGSARADLGAVDYRGVPLLFKSVEVWADHLVSGVRYADVYYKLDDGARTLLGRAQDSPRTTLYFPTDEEVFVSGRALALSVESFAASRNLSPVYRSFVLNATLRPDPADLITAVVRIADNMRDRQGGEMRPGATMVEELRAFARAKQPYKLIDLTGAASWVAVLSPVGEVETYQEGEDFPEVAATVRMALLDYTVNLGAPILGLGDAGVMAGG